MKVVIVKSVANIRTIAIFFGLFAVVLFVLSGCSYQGSLGEVSCDTENPCPQGAECVSGYCIDVGEELDSGSGEELDVETAPDSGDAEDPDVGDGETDDVGDDTGDGDPDVGECTHSDDCESHQICDDGLCICNETRTAGEVCGDASAECGIVTDACGESVDCPQCSGDQLCSDNHQCVDCREQSDCDQGELCSANTCIPDVQCQNDGECGDDQACEGGSCVCSESRTDTEVCSQAGAQCGTVLDICNETVTCADCTGGEVCLGIQCVECTSNSDCTGECSICNGDNECVDSNNACGDCESCSGGSCSSDCTDEQTCLNMTCVECTGDDDCIDGACSSDNECVECTADTHCSGCEVCSGEVCVDEDAQCTGCESCSESICVDDDSRCSDGQVCSQTMCEECFSDGDCPGSEVCVDNACEECPDCDSCANDNQCDGCESCVGGTCADDHNNCTGDGALYCSDSDCVECSADSHCSYLSGWYDDGDEYSCCATGSFGGRYSCTCQDRKYRSYRCDDEECKYDVTGEDTVRIRWSCGYCGIGGSCSSGTCD